MAVVVDDAMILWRNRRWCHLFSDRADHEELHAFAGLIGLRRSWFQESPQPWLCHYDVTARLRDIAIRHGAREVTWREAGHMIMALADAARARTQEATP